MPYPEPWHNRPFLADFIRWVLIFRYKMLGNHMGKLIKIFITLAMVASNAVASGDAEKGQKAFKKCKSCHMIMDDSGKTIIKGSRAGPNLYGILGRIAGSVDDFKYGKSLATLGTTGFVWTEAEFVTYVADPKKFLVNKLDNKKARSKMSFKLKKDADARNIWAYLVSVSE